MPRAPRQQKAPLIPSTALVASATRYPGAGVRIYRPSQDWQRECYRHYAICGEARFAAKFFGHAVSRAVLHVAEVKEGKEVRLDKGPEVDQLAVLFNGKDGQEQMLDSIGTHLTIAGECYLVGRTPLGGENEIWEIISCLEMQVNGVQWTINYGDGLAPIQLTKNDVVIRIWTSNPARRIEADSPFRSLLPILSEIEYLTLHVFSQIRSRLLTAGILFLSDKMQFPPPGPGPDGKAVEYTNQAHAFMKVLADVMMATKPGTGQPSEVVPIVVTADAESIDKVKLLTFWSDLDAEAKALREEAIRRFALGMDLPPEQVLGMGSNPGSGGGRSTGVSHWGAWQIEEATIKLHVEPILGVVVNAITIGYLRPAVEGTKGKVVFDTSALRLRPDRSKEAFELYDRGWISGKALVRESGFDPDDIPDDTEFKRWLLVKVATGSATPEQVQAALASLGVDLGPLANVGTPNEARPVPSLENHPTRPRTPDESALLHVCEALVIRGLERAGNRMRAQGTRPPNVPAYETHCHAKVNGAAAKFMQDAFGTHAVLVLEGVADPETVVPVLDSYCTALLTEGSPHDRARLATWLTTAGVA